MPTYENLVQNNIINFHLIVHNVYYHCELFIELYEECHKAGKEKFLRLQIAGTIGIAFFIAQTI